MPPKDQEDQLELHGALRVLRRRWPIVVLCAVLVPAAALAWSLSQDKEYSAAAKLLFRDPAFDQKLFQSQVLETSRDTDREAATNVRLVSLEAVANRAERRLPRQGNLSNKIEVTEEEQSNVVSITATDTNPAASARIANVFAEEYIRFRREADRAKIREAQRLVQRQLAQVSRDDPGGSQSRPLRDRAQELQILAALQTGNAELVERATRPSAPSSPRPLRNTVLGGLIGVLLGVGLAFLFERLDRRIRDPREFEAIFERPVLGAIPNSRTLSKGGPTLRRSASADAEAFRMLRANLRYFNVDRSIKSVLVTSAAPGDGKTTIAWNLAAAAAGAGGKSLFIEADLRHPRIARDLGVDGSVGLSTLLSGRRELAEVIQQVPVTDSGNGRAGRTVDVLVAGPLPPNPSDLVESERMQALIAMAEQHYDLVVIDTPPTSFVSDAIPLVARVGGVMVVGRLAKSTREATTHLHNQLRNLEAPTLGVVVNGVGSESEAYGYVYGYRYGYEPQSQ